MELDLYYVKFAPDIPADDAHRIQLDNGQCMTWCGRNLLSYHNQGIYKIDREYLHFMGHVIHSGDIQIIKYSSQDGWIMVKDDTWFCTVLSFMRCLEINKFLNFLYASLMRYIL